MDMNFLSHLFQAPGLAVDPDTNYGAPSAPAPQGSGVPADLLAGIAGYGDTPNVLQTLNPGAPADALPPQAPPAPAQPAPARRSILDTIGRVSDVLAKVGGADALYQPTLDARQDRALALGDHARAVDTAALKDQQTRAEILDKGADTAKTLNPIIATAAKGMQAIRAANPNADISTVWPLLAKQAGIPDDRAAALGTLFKSNPEALNQIVEAADKSDDKFSGNIIYTKDAEGNLHAYQPNVGTGTARDILPAGMTPIDPLKFVDTGGAQVGVGTRSGNPTRILPKMISPDRAAQIKSAETIAAGRNATQVQIAGMPARSKAAAASATPEASNVLTLLDNIQHGFGDLHQMKALPGSDGGVVGNVFGAIGRTGIGQAIGEQAGSPAAQKRLEIAKNVSALQQAMLKSLPASATRTKFEQEMLARGLPDPAKMSYGTAQTVIGQLRESYMRAVQAAQPKSQTPARPRANSGGWSVVGVK